MRSKTNAQRNAKGCLLCGDPKIGRGLSRHVEDTHSIPYNHYRQCFTQSGKVITNQLIDTGSTTKKGTKRVILHVLVKEFRVPITLQEG
jgi:hypothetical protein